MICRIFFALILIFTQFIGATQCLESPVTFGPDTIVPSYTEFGSALDSFEDILVVSDISNDSLAYNGGLVHVYKLNDDGTHKHLAVLSPLNHLDTMFFGREISISDNFIAATGNSRSPSINNYQSVYIFEKNPEDEWTDSNEIMKIDMVDPTLVDHSIIVHRVELNNKYLAVYYFDTFFGETLTYEARVNVYEINSGFTLLKTIVLPKDENGNQGTNFSDLALGDNYLAVSAASLILSSNNSGVVYIYYEGEFGKWNSEPDLTLYPSSLEHGFGIDLEIYENNLFATGRSTNRFRVQDVSQVSFFHGDALLDSINTPAIRYDFPIIEGQLRISIDVNENYLIKKRDGDEYVIHGFKKTTQWGESAEYFSHDLDSSTYFEFNRGMVVSDKSIFLHTESNLEGQQGRVNVYYHLDGKLESADFNGIISAFSYFATDDFFGQNVSISNDNLVVGVPGDTDKGSFTGAVYIYKKNLQNLWEFKSKIYPPKITRNNYFGGDVLVTDQDLFVCDHRYDSLDVDGNNIINNMGVVYHYKLFESEWKLFNKILPPQVYSSTPQNYDVEWQQFGRRLAKHNDYLAISQFNNSSSSNKGQLYVYKKDSVSRNWEYEATLSTTFSNTTEFYGDIIDMSDSVIAMGKYYVPFSFGSFDGRVLIYTRKGSKWVSGTEDAVLNVQDEFFTSINIVNDSIILAGSAFQEAFTDSDPKLKRVHVFKRPHEGWKGTLTASKFLEPSDASAATDFFGYSIHSNGYYVFVGEPREKVTGNIYRYDIATIYNNDPVVYETHIINTSLATPTRDYFGYSLAGNDANDLVVGAPFSKSNNSYYAGVIHIYNSGVTVFPVNNPLCIDDEVAIDAFPSGLGTWSGVGITDPEQGVFKAEVAREGYHQVYYTYDGCFAKINVEVFKPPQVLNSTERILRICEGESVELSISLDEPGYKAQWYYRPDSEVNFELLADNHELKMVVSNPGEYYCHVPTLYCETPDTYFRIDRKYAAGSLNLTGEQILCEDESLDLTILSNSEITGFNWYRKHNDKVESISSNEQLQNINADGEYFCKFEVDGCTYYTDTMSINRIIINPFIKDVPRICDPDDITNIQVYPTGGQLYIDDIINSDFLIDPKDFENGIHELYYQIDTAHCIYRAENEVEIRKANIELQDIPNVFTPNNDGFNDSFFIKDTFEDFETFSLTIVDRNGMNVFTSESPYLEWDGAGQPNGQYYWFISLKDGCTEKGTTYTGYVQLLR